MLRSHMQCFHVHTMRYPYPVFINLKRSTTKRRPRLTNKPNTRMVRNSMTTMFDYNNVKTVENHEPYNRSRIVVESPSSIHTVDHRTIRFDIDILQYLYVRVFIVMLCVCVQVHLYHFHRNVCVRMCDGCVYVDSSSLHYDCWLKDVLVFLPLKRITEQQQ